MANPLRVSCRPWSGRRILTALAPPSQAHRSRHRQHVVGWRLGVGAVRASRWIPIASGTNVGARLRCRIADLPSTPRAVVPSRGCQAPSLCALLRSVPRWRDWCFGLGGFRRPSPRGAFTRTEIYRLARISSCADCVCAADGNCSRARVVGMVGHREPPAFGVRATAWRRHWRADCRLCRRGLERSRLNGRWHRRGLE